MKNKKADLAVTLLVFMSIVVAGAASLIFVISSGTIKERVVDARFMDEIYLTEGKLDFTLQEIFDSAVVGFEDDEEKLINNFKQELNKYKVGKAFVIQELFQVEEQINKNPDAIKYDKENKIVTAKFKIVLGARAEAFHAVHTYIKKFEKEI